MRPKSKGAETVAKLSDLNLTSAPPLRKKARGFALVACSFVPTAGNVTPKNALGVPKHFGEPKSEHRKRRSVPNLVIGVIGAAIQNAKRRFIFTILKAGAINRKRFDYQKSSNTQSVLNSSARTAISKFTIPASKGRDLKARIAERIHNETT